jgi:LAO/AO transport system kinase
VALERSSETLRNAWQTAETNAPSQDKKLVIKMHELSKRIVAGEVRALARGISYIEDQHRDRLTILKDLHAHKDRAYKIGITGAPGAGKSSLVNRLVSYLRQQKLTVGIIAVDPTSPFTGGALLGDRVRMANHFTDPDVYIRSMGTRGSLGGLARATKEAVHLVDAFGKDVIIIETVGVGQSELDIMNVADSTAVILTPGGGDTVQAFKAGIMEIADLYMINKSDLAGADKLHAEINHMLDIVKHDASWRPPVTRTISTKNEGIAEMWGTFQDHVKYLTQSGEGQRRKQERLVDEMTDVLEHQFLGLMQKQMENPNYQEKIKCIQTGELDPYTVAEELFKQWVRKPTATSELNKEEG